MPLDYFQNREIGNLADDFVSNFDLFVMNVDEKLISRLAHLARLELSGAEREKIQKDLNNILGMVEKLNELDTASVEPLVYVSEQQNVLREDVVQNQLARERGLQNAPKQNGDYFVVPKVIDLK
ncbi:MAG: Asp-tRNA(Asn)/Glu-tRNA(Gln) amidotransferase subunit GatC [Saprospiraceae bacterium]